jgi:hypothetical protein
MNATDTRDQQMRFEQSIVRTNQQYIAMIHSLRIWLWIAAITIAVESVFIVIQGLMLLEKGTP